MLLGVTRTVSCCKGSNPAGAMQGDDGPALDRHGTSEAAGEDSKQGCLLFST